MKKKFLFPIVMTIIAYILSSVVPAFEAPAYACGGWWDPCCPWWEPDRCAAFDAKKRENAAANEGYFSRMEERLNRLADYAGWLPAGSLASKALREGAKAAKAAKEANGAVARGTPSDTADAYAVRSGPTYTDTGYEWVNNLNRDLVDLFSYGNYAAGQSQQYTSCMQETYEDWGYCNGYYYNANWAIGVFGWLHGEMGYDLEVLAWQVEQENGGDWPYGDITYWLRDAAQVSYDTEGVLQ